MAFEDRFKLRLPLGEGELGAVWDAEDQKLGTAVAVALLEEDAPAEVRARFIEAAKVLKPLDHPSIVRVLDYGESDGGAAFMAMELIRGQTLLERLGEGPALRIEQLVSMTIDLLEGLEKVHAAGHVHGDIEPGNFVLVEDGTGMRLKLIGFGLNRAEMRGGTVDESQDGAESALRSFACMSPEQARKEVVADVRGDVYGVGAVLYDALTGSLPYRGMSVGDIRQAVATGGAKPVHEVRSELAGALAGAVDRAMSHKPMRRFADATAMRKALRAALIMSPKVKGLDVQIAPRKLDRDSSVHEAPPAAEAAPDAPSEIEAPVKTTTPGGTEAPAPFEPIAPVPAPAEEPAAKPSADTGPGGQPRTRGPKRTMLGVAPPPPASAMPPPAVKAAAAKTPAATSPKPDPKHIRAFSDEHTEELSIEDFAMLDMGKAPPPTPSDPSSTLKSPAVPPPPSQAPPPGPSVSEAPPPVPGTVPPAAAVMPPAPAPGTPAASAPPPEITSQAIADETLDSGVVSFPATGGPSRKLYIGGGIAAAAILLIVLIASGGDDPEEAAVEAAAPPQTERAEPEAEEPEPEPEPEPVAEPEPEPEPETVELALTGVPEGATVTLDGEPVTGTSIELPRGEESHELRVTAEGYEPFSQTLTAAEDSDVAVEMVEVEEPEPAVVAERPQRRIQRRPPRRTTQRRTTSRASRMRPRVVRDPGF